jgi:hypothetical protein
MPAAVRNTSVSRVVANDIRTSALIQLLAVAAAPLTISQSIPGVVDTIQVQAGKGGLWYLDYRGQTVRW